jgi:hypothetical protein
VGCLQGSAFLQLRRPRLRVIAYLDMFCSCITH